MIANSSRLGVFLVIAVTVMAVMAIASAYLVIKTKRQNLGVRKLESNNREYYKFLENIPNKIIRYDKKTKKAYASKLSDYYLNSRDEHLVKAPLTYLYSASDIDYERNVRDVLISRRNNAAHLNLQAANGKKRTIRIEWVPEFGHAGELISILTIGQDVTDSIERQQRIDSPGYFDQLTHLPNRTLLLERIKEIIHSTDSIVQPSFALLVLDIDEFKEVNDLLGYAASDLLICEAVSRLNTVLGHTDMLARLGGDQFAILLPQIQSKTELTWILGDIMALFTWPFQMFAQELSITISIGAVLYPCNAQEANHVLNYADTAMHSAKELGRSNIQFYKEEMTERSMARTVLDAALRKAVVQEELVLYYQPQIDLASQELLGAEALIRWQHPALGLLSPDRFIPLAEETGQINEIGTWVLGTAFRAAVAWNKLSNAPIQIAVNLSTRQFFRNDIVMTIRTLMADTGCLPIWIKLEITESLLLDKSADILNKLVTLSELGFDISIDDFGTGYSALSYLASYPISQIKIDRSFISDIPLDLDKAELVKIIIQISKVLHLDIVAEGIEREAQAEYLYANGCYTVQGFLYGKPMPHSQFEYLVRTGCPSVAA